VAKADVSEGNRQRLDKWIWFARVVRSREAAAELVLAGNVRVNRNRITKPGYDVSPGDVLTITVHGKVRVLEVIALAARRGPPEAARLVYREQAISKVDGVQCKNEDAEPPRTC
jgi:ribosome-associated heat shock protein Hsp15